VKRKYLKWNVAGLTVWAASVVVGIWGCKRMGIWNLDVYVGGVSTGVLVAILASRLSRYTERQLQRSNEELARLERQAAALR
jgi:hypothetical protein